MSEKTIFDRLSEYIDYAEATKNFSDAAFYKELYMLLGNSIQEAEHQQKQLELLDNVWNDFCSAPNLHDNPMFSLQEIISNLKQRIGEQP